MWIFQFFTIIFIPFFINFFHLNAVVFDCVNYDWNLDTWTVWSSTPWWSSYCWWCFETGRISGMKIVLRRSYSSLKTVSKSSSEPSKSNICRRSWSFSEAKQNILNNIKNAFRLCIPCSRISSCIYWSTCTLGPYFDWRFPGSSCRNLCLNILSVRSPSTQLSDSLLVCRIGSNFKVWNIFPSSARFRHLACFKLKVVQISVKLSLTLLELMISPEAEGWLRSFVVCDFRLLRGKLLLNSFIASCCLFTIFSWSSSSSCNSWFAKL